MRKTPLQRKTPLKSGSSLARSTPMPKGTKPMKKVNKGRMAAKIAEQHKWYASKEWQAMRLATFARDHWTCVDCGWNALETAGLSDLKSMLHGKQMGGDWWLECDHITNARFGGKERPSDLATRCNFCHILRHAKQLLRPRGLRRAG